MYGVPENIYGKSWRTSDDPTEPLSSELNLKPGERQTVKIRINKQTHSAPRYEDESEESVTLVIDPKVIG